MTFRDRADAAEQLVLRLETSRSAKPLVLGIPRGGVPMAAIVADRLGGDLDVVLVHKLRAPDQPELAVGSVDEAGRVYLAPFSEDLGFDEHALDAEKLVQLATLKARRARYTAARPPLDPAGRTVVIVDDGLATGSTMIAAIRAVRARRPARLVVAVGVAPAATIARLRTEADDIVCLHAPASFRAVGEFFEDFGEVTDDEVVRILAQRRPARAVTETPVAHAR